MKIYTKTGDDGTTGLFGGGRLSKDSSRIDAYGTIDELNSVLGIVRTCEGAHSFEHILSHVQVDLFVLGADLATPLEARSNYTIPRIDGSDVTRLEQAIDSEEAHLQSLTKFILPGGSSLAAHLHLARTITRRAERKVIHLSKEMKIGLSDIIYLNRLSDLLFVLARRANQVLGKQDVEWDGKK